MSIFFRVPAVTAGCIFALGSMVHADEEMDRILKTAMPHMHHSCESILANYPDDEEAVAEIVRLMAMVSLFNREINVEEAVPGEAERATLSTEFVDRLEEVCEADQDTLLAGAVDIAVKDALN